MKLYTISLLHIFLLLFNVSSGSAHFGMLIPEHPVVDATNRSIQLDISFSHPFEGHGMDLAKPAQLHITTNGSRVNLLPTLKESTIMKHRGWTANFDVTRPGVYHVVMEPVPYWEPTEDLSIIHYTKVIIPAFGSDSGWDQPVGLPTEIIPLLRPFGNYAGNTFVGKVLVNGKIAAGAEVEVEYYNQDQTVTAASDYHITQVIKADDNGVFTFSCPKPGWWGFAALSEADYTLKNPQGEEKGVELGAVLWTYMSPLI